MTSLRFFGLALVLAPAAAHGQSRDPFLSQPAGPLLRDDVAGSRQIPGYEPAGVQVGALRVLPAVTGSVEGDTNVLNRTSDKRRDVYFTLAPAVTASGGSGKAAYVLRAEAAVTRFATLAKQNRETWKLGAQASVPLAGRVTVAVSGGYAREVEPNYAASAAATVGSPALYDQLSGEAGLSVDLGTTRLTGTAGVLRVDYRPVVQVNGGVVDQSFRDQRTMTLGLKGEHGLPGGQELFAQGEYHWIDSLHAPLCCDRTSTGGNAVGGFRAQLGHLIEAEVAAGYQWRNYRSPAFRDYAGLAWRTKLEWYATSLVSVALSGRRDIANSGIPTAAGVVVDTLMLRVFYEMRRNLNFILTGARTHDDYRDTGQTADGETVKLEGRYVINDRYALGAYGRHRNRSSDSSALPRLGSALEGGLSLRFTM